MDDPVAAWGIATKHFANDASEIFGHFVGIMQAESSRQGIPQDQRLTTYRELTRESGSVIQVFDSTTFSKRDGAQRHQIVPFDNKLNDNEFDWLYSVEHDPHRDDGIQFMTDDLCDDGWCPTPVRCLNDDMCLRTVIEGKRRGGIID